MDEYPFRQRQAAIRIGVDPLFRREQLQAAFPDIASITEHGILPIRVQVENAGAQEIHLAPADFVLTTARGSRNAGLSPEDAVNLVKADAGLWKFVPIPIVGQSAMAMQRTKEEKELISRALPSTPIPPGGAAAGFVYFYFPSNEYILTGAQLEVRVTSASDEAAFTFPLRGRRDLLGPGAAPEKSATPPPAPARQEGTAGQGVIIRSPAP
jgi:hypothetical protein